MKLWIYIWIVLMMAVMGCNAPTTSPRPSSGGEGVASRALENIDSLMWHHPDSALAVMMELAGSPKADSLNVFEKHYCQLLVSELLYKNDYGQSNRTELLQAVHYFDSLMQVPELVEGPTPRPQP